MILGNPNTFPCRMGGLPGFFDLDTLTMADIAAIVGAPFVAPLVGNRGPATVLGHARRLLTSPGALRRMNRAAGNLLISDGPAIPFVSLPNMGVCG